MFKKKEKNKERKRKKDMLRVNKGPTARFPAPLLISLCCLRGAKELASVSSCWVEDQQGGLSKDKGMELGPAPNLLPAPLLLWISKGHGVGKAGFC